MKPLGLCFLLLLVLYEFSVAQDRTSAPASSREDLAQTLAFNDTIQGSKDAPPQDFIEVDKEPTVISRKDPVYPELALRAGLEGKVWVKVWVDTQGKARKVELLKSDNDIFDSSAIEAARQFVFTPAYLHGNPVSVWVSIPFKFKMGTEDGKIAENFRNLRSLLKHPAVLIIAGPKQLKSHITYPARSIKSRVEGAVYAIVTLSEERNVSEMRITKSLDKFCDMAVMSGIASYDFATDKELPATSSGTSISIVVQFILPVK